VTSAKDNRFSIPLSVRVKNGTWIGRNLAPSGHYSNKSFVGSRREQTCPLRRLATQRCALSYGFGLELPQAHDQQQDVKEKQRENHGHDRQVGKLWN